MQMVNPSVHFVTRDSIRRHKYSVTIIGAVQLDFENLLYLVSLNMLSCSINPDPVFSLLCPVPPPGQRSNVQSSSWTPVTNNNNLTRAQPLHVELLQLVQLLHAAVLEAPEQIVTPDGHHHHTTNQDR